MSARPSGPSSRPNFSFASIQASIPQIPTSRTAYDGYQPLLPSTTPFQIESAPRLRERSLLSRIICCLPGIVCIGISIYLSIMAFQTLFPEATNPFISNNVQATPPALKQRSLLKRLSMLRTTLDSNRLDLAWTRQLFPHWFSPEDGSHGETMDQQEVLGDAILSLSFITKDLIGTDHNDN